MTYRRPGQEQYGEKIRTLGEIKGNVTMWGTNPSEVKTQTIKVKIKSFIAVIGSQVGTVPGVATIPIRPQPFEIIPVPVPRQTLLQILAK